MRLRSSVALAAVVAAVACGPGATSTPQDDTADTDDHSAHSMAADPEGVIEVANRAEGLWAGSEHDPLRFELDQVFGAADDSSEAALKTIAGAVVDLDGRVYVYDSNAAQLVAFGPDGTVLWRAGGNGDELNSFSDVRGIASNGTDTIWVVNRQGAQLDEWGLDGTYRTTTTLADLGITRVFMGGVLPPDRVALVDDVFEMGANEYIVVRTGEAPAIDARFRIDAEPALHVPQGFIFQLSHTFHHDHILVGNWARYSLRVFDDTGMLQRRVTRDVDYLRPPGFALQGGSTSAISLGGLSAPLTLSDGHWLVYASWPTNVADANAFAEIPPDQRPPVEWASSLDLFDADGRFLYSEVTEGAPLPAIGRPWATSPNALLYTVSTEPFPQVRRYTVHIEPPEGH